MTKAKARPPVVPERAILGQVLELLTLRGVPHWRSNTGAVRFGGRYVRFGRPGVADVLGVVPRSGRFLAVECKRPGGRLTADQAAFLAAVDAAGGVALVVDDVRTLHAALEALEREPWRGLRPEGVIP